MEEALLKERFEELQNTITMSSTNTLGASDTTQTGALKYVVSRKNPIKLGSLYK